MFADVAAATSAVTATPKRLEKIAILADVMRRCPPQEVQALVGILLGEPRQGRVGVGWATVAGVGAEAAEIASLDVADVDAAFGAVASAQGSGSGGERRRILTDLWCRATLPEQDLLRRVLTGEVRHGALAGVVTDAVARAADVPVASVRRAAMRRGDLGEAAELALTEGAGALDAVGLTVLRPVQPMLAASAPDVGEALGHTGPAAVEWKLDGARVQVHKLGEEVRLFTRNLNDVTARLDGVRRVIAAMAVHDVVLDAEVLGLDDDGRPRRFQDTMGDFGADAAGRGSGLQAFVFDALHAGGESLLDRPLGERLDALDDLVPAALRIPSVRTAEAGPAATMLADAIGHGHEGVMVKALDAPYDAGRRGGAWRKVKPVHTVDLVVLAAEWGSGRRRGWLSNLHLGARGSDGTFVMVGKTFKGLTDQLLAWQTAELQSRAIGTETAAGAHVVHVRPELVVEIALDGVQVSRRYAGGVALRFARVRRYRPDKTASEADTIDAVRGLLR